MCFTAGLGVAERGNGCFDPQDETYRRELASVACCFTCFNLSTGTDLICYMTLSLSSPRLISERATIPKALILLHAINKGLDRLRLHGCSYFTDLSALSRKTCRRDYSGSHIVVRGGHLPKLEADSRGFSAVRIPQSLSKHAKMVSETRGDFVTERKAMEEARLARLAKKRGVPVDSDPGGPPAKLTKLSSCGNLGTDRAVNSSTLESRKTGEQSLTDQPRPDYVSAIHAPGFQPASTTIQYPRGIIKKTYAEGFQRKDDIKIEEVLQIRTLKHAMISGFVIDPVWFLSKFPKGSKTTFTFVAHGSEAQPDRVLEQVVKQLPNVRRCYPPRRDREIMHSKLMLLFHDTHVRIVIPTANPISTDWGEKAQGENGAGNYVIDTHGQGGTMENTIFLIDLPRLSEASNDEEQWRSEDAEQRLDKQQVKTRFGTDMLRFLRAQNIPNDIIKTLRKHDWSLTNDIQFVHTRPVSTKVDDGRLIGYGSLRAAIDSLGLILPRSEHVEIDIAASSIGALNDTQLETLQRAVRGRHIEAKSTSTAKGKQQQLLYPHDPMASPPSTGLRIVYPSIATVQNSKGGILAGGTLFCNFPSTTMHEYISRRGRADRDGKGGPLSHSKIILVRSSSHAFVYVGSHNISQAAWGKLERLVTKGIRCNANNWECGVVVPIRRLKAAKKEAIEIVDEADVSTASEDEDEVQVVKVVKRVNPGTTSKIAGIGESVANEDKQMLPFSVFEQVIDVPFEWPPRKYGKDDKPWSATMLQE